MIEQRLERSEKLYYAYTLCGDIFQYKEYPDAIDKVVNELEKILNYYKTRRSVDNEYVIENKIKS